VTTFYEVLENYRNLALDEHDKGMRFENFVQRFMTVDPVFSSRFDNVIHFRDWDGREDLRDRGIDLIGFEKITGELCAIQCKFYGQDERIDLPTISTFFAELGKKDFSYGDPSHSSPQHKET
jgi:predicted helicase